MSKDVVSKEQIDALNKAINKENDDTESVLQVRELSKFSDKYLTGEAKQVLDKKATQTVVKYDSGKTYICAYFVVGIRTGREEKSVKKIALVINELVEQKLIHSCLAPISALELARRPMQAPASIVFCYPLVPADKLDEINEKYKDIMIKDGGMPPLENLDPELEDGEFLTEFRYTHTLTSMSNTTPEKRLKKDIDMLLSILPSGTIVREKVLCAISDLSLPYEVKFYNPLLKKVKSIKLDWMRAGELVDDYFEQFNVFTGIRYFDQDKNELFK